MRLIDGDAIIEEYCGDCAYRGTELCDENEPSCGTAGWIKDAPTVDAVPVVRCKECAKRPTCKHTRALGINGYCSDGERRNDGEIH